MSSYFSQQNLDALLGTESAPVHKELLGSEVYSYMIADIVTISKKGNITREAERLRVLHGKNESHKDWSLPCRKQVKGIRRKLINQASLGGWDETGTWTSI